MGNRSSAQKLEQVDDPEDASSNDMAGEDDNESGALGDDFPSTANNMPPEPEVVNNSSDVLLPKPDQKFYCFRRLCRELICCQPWFHATEPVNQRAISVPESFAPNTWLAFLFKCMVAGIAGGTFAYRFFATDNPEFQMAYMTMWGVLCCVLYLMLSALNTVFSERTGQPQPSASIRIRTTWVLFELGVHLSVLASVGFFLFLFDDDIPSPLAYLTYFDLSTHVGIALVVLVDGLWINRIPFRFQHYFGIILPVEVLYVVWTYIHTLAKVGNPDADGASSIYPNILEWTGEEWPKTLILAAIIVFGVGPLSFVVLWSISNGLFCCRDIRRYEDDIDETDNRPTVHDVEEGSIFGRWSTKRSDYV